MSKTKPIEPVLMQATPAQRVAMQIRGLIYSIPEEILKQVNGAHFALINGVKPQDGSMPVTSEEIVAALGDIDYQTIKAQIEFYKRILK